MLNEFFRLHEDDLIWWIDNGCDGDLLFSFDKEHIYNMFSDYPWKLNRQEKEIFDKENPYWADFFKNRSKGM